MPAATTQSPPVRAGRASRFDQCRSLMCCCSYLERSPVELTLKVDASSIKDLVLAVQRIWAQDLLWQPEDDGCGDADSRHEGVSAAVIAG